MGTPQCVSGASDFTNSVNKYHQKKVQLLQSWSPGSGQFRLAKSTISNLFRYQRHNRPARQLSLRDFNEVIGLDPEQGILEVEGLTTYETIVGYCLAQGFLPLVSPELRHITVGGAIVGIGIESTCFRHGFVHDSLLEADVLLPDGQIVNCSPDNEYSDLFHALPNSYGTLGYILRARIALQNAAPYVHIAIEKYENHVDFLAAMRNATTREDLDFIEGLFFEDNRYFLMLSRFADSVPFTDDILRKHIFYKLIQERTDIYLKSEDYIFRYDPDWFWNVPDNRFYKVFRKYAPHRFRNSAFYSRYLERSYKIRHLLRNIWQAKTEPLIQDWEVPWKHAEELVEFCLKNVSLSGRPWAAVPIRTTGKATLYPVKPDELYFNLGCYCGVRKLPGKEPYHYTRIMDRKCFELGGIKMLYSTTFLDESEFAERFNGSAYQALKKKYDRAGHAPSLYAKVTYASSG